MDQAGGKKPSMGFQSSIRSFFPPRVAGYTAPPSTTISNSNGSQTFPPVSLPTPIIPKPPKPQLETSSDRPPANPPIPRQAIISTIHEKHVKPLKHINSQLLPISYPDTFYREIITNSPNFSQVILWQDAPSKSSLLTTPEPKVVGGIVCRVEDDNDTRKSSVYIRSLSLLSPYRSYGLATAALEAIIRDLVAMPTTHYSITSLYAHVWTENREGLEWYTKRGFTKETPVLQGYYKRLRPGDAWVMRRDLVPSDHLRHAPLQSPTTPSAPAPAPTITTKSPPPPPPSLKTPSETVSPSYQTTGPGHEWNDLPPDILLPPIPSADHLRPASGNASAASSRSSSSTRNGGRKKKREYPAAAFAAAGLGSGN